MKNVPITGKILSVLSIFGVFTIGVAFYSTSEIRGVVGGYTGLIEGPGAALVSVIRAFVDVQVIRFYIAQLTMNNAPAEIQRATTDISGVHGRFVTYLTSGSRRISGRIGGKIRT